MSLVTIHFSYLSVNGERSKQLQTSDTPLLALMKYFGKFGAVAEIKIIDASTVIVIFPEGCVEVFNVSIEGRRGRKPLQLQA